MAKRTMRVNRLIRETSISLQDICNVTMDEDILPTDKFSILTRDECVVKKSSVVSYDLTIEELLAIRNKANNILRVKMEELQARIDNKY